MTSAPPDAGFEVDDFPAVRQSLRIAVVTETYPPEVNGVAATIASFVDGLRGRNHVVQLIRPRQTRVAIADSDDRFDEVLLRGLPIPRYPHLKMGLPSMRALAKLWTRQRPDLVHVVTEGPLGWSALRAATRLRLPVCSDFRTNFHAYSQHYGLGWLRRPILGYLRKFHNRTHLTLVPTEALRSELIGFGFNNVRVVGRGVDTRLFSPLKRSAELRGAWRAGPETTVVLHVGRLAPEKNLAALASIYDELQTFRRKPVFVFVGDGPMRSELERRCPRAIFAGMRMGEDLAAHYASGDVFLFPSMTETFGNVTTEAMASGLAVVAYDYAAAARLIRHGESGLLAPVGDGLRFKRLALEAACNPRRAMQLGRQARLTAEAHAWPALVEQLERCFLQVVAAAGAADASAVGQAPQSSEVA